MRNAVGVGANYFEACRSACGEGADNAKEALKGVTELLSGSRPDFYLEYPCHSPTKRRWFVMHATRFDSPSIGAVLLHIDITDRKLVEERLYEQEERFRFALENSPVVVFNQDRELRYTWINSPVLDWAEQEYIGRTDADIVGGVEAERLTAIKRAVLESGVGTRVEVTVTFKGEARYFDLNVAPLRDDVGAIIGITCACTDITRMKRAAAERERLIEELGNAERELTKRNLELEALNKEKTQWLGMAAHDLRSPLSAIIANCYLLMEESTSTGGELSAALNSIQYSSQFMLELLDDVLDISAIETGNERFGYELTDIRLVIEEAVALSRPIADRKSTHIEVRYPERMPALTLDRRKMTQVFLNVIGNAIKFSQTCANVQITVVDESTNVLVSVRDNGPGIPLDELESIFMPFQRGCRHSAERGTGLGLAISKRIVERHGGRIWAENAIDGGAAFYLSLPRQIKDSSPVHSTHPEASVRMA